MADTTPDAPESPAKRSRMPLVAGLVLALAGGGGGFFAVQQGYLPFGADKNAGKASSEASEVAPPDMPDIAFVAVDPIVVSIGPPAANRHLRLRAELEVAAGYAGEVETLMPRVMDVLNSYLRALDLRDFESRTALMTIRAQLLRRIQVVTGEGRVKDLLIMEFVLN